MREELCDRHPLKILFGACHRLRPIQNGTAIVPQGPLLLSNKLQLDLVNLGLYLGIGFTDVYLELRRKEILCGGDMLPNNWLAVLPQGFLES